MKAMSGLLLLLVSSLAYAGGDSGLTGYWLCQSAADQDTIYFSSTWKGTTHNDDLAFAQFLNAKHGYKGKASCSLAYESGNTMAMLQREYDARVAGFRRQGKKIVETGWTNNGAAALTSNAPEQTAEPVVAKPKTPVPDSDDHPMAATKNVPMSHFYCSTQKSGDKPLYFTGAFEAPSSDLAAVNHAFQAYLSQKYGYGGAIAISCFNNASVAAADQRKQASIANLKKTAATVIDTGWMYKAQ